MNSLPSESFEVEGPQQQLKDEESRRLERTHWLLTSPNPPGMLKELTNSLKASVLPKKNKLSSSSVSKNPQIKLAASFLQGLFPILVWARNYKASKFKDDLLAGLTLASLCIPQSIGYANLARLEPQYGLYTSVVPPLVYALMGSSREIAVGPVAVVSMLLSSMAPKVVDPSIDPVAYTNLVFTVTLFAGTFQAAFGVFRLGFLVDFLSHAAIVGFMGGAAIVIGLQQLKGLLGLSHFTNKTDVISVLRAVFTSLQHQLRSEKLDHWYPLNFVIGCAFLIFILLTRFIGKRNNKYFWLPAVSPLVSVILSTFIVYVTRADKHGVSIVRHFKGGLNQSSVHRLQLHGPHIGQAAKIGLICAVVALTEAIAVGRSFASIKGYNLDGNKEMLAMGFANLAGSMSSCYVATGSFSRTAVNFSAGCQTAMSNIVMAVTVVASLELLTRLLYFTPVSILASIILSALPGLIDISEARHIWKVDKLDFLACLGAFLGVLFHTVETGLLAAVTISFAKIILGSIRPGIEELGKLPGTDIFCDTRQYPMAVKTPGILIIRVDSSSFCFANASFIRDRIIRYVKKEDGGAENMKEKIQVLILEMSGVMNIDTSAIIALEELHKKLVSSSIELAMANPRWQVIHKLKTANFTEKIGRERMFLTVGEAVEACHSSKMVHLT